MLPEPFATALLFQHRLEQRRSELLDLVNQEGQHHQQNKDQRQILLAVTIVMFQMIALIFEGIEGLIFDFPAGASPAHQFADIEFGHGEVGDLTEVLGFVRGDLPIFDEIDPQVLMGCVQGHLIDETKAVEGVFDLLFIDRGLTRLMRRLDIIKQKGMVAFFDPQNVVQIVLVQFSNMGPIGA